MGYAKEKNIWTHEGPREKKNIGTHEGSKVSKK
jgi:hypothetical protein